MIEWKHEHEDESIKLNTLNLIEYIIDAPNADTAKVAVAKQKLDGIRDGVKTHIDKP